MSLPLAFWLYLKASLFSTGGFGNLPSLHADLVLRHVATERDFAEALTLGQVSPGPNGLWSVSLGTLTGGIPGGLVATLALAVPPFFVLAVERAWMRLRHLRQAEGALRGLTLALTGIFLVALAYVLRGTGVTVATCAIASGAAALSCFRRVPVVAIVAAGAAAGILLR